MASSPRSGARTAELDPALRAVDEVTAGTSLPGGARDASRSRAEVLYLASGSSREALAIAQLAYAAELLSLIAIDLAADPAEARRLIDQLEARAGVPRLALGQEVLQIGRLLEMPVDVGIEARLALLLAFTGAHGVALCAVNSGEELELISCAGEAAQPNTWAHRELVRRVLGGRPGSEGPLFALRLERLRPPPAVLLAEAMEVSTDEGELLLGAAAPILSALLDRDTRATSEPANHDSVLGSVERRLARLRFDLHDGPQQDVHLLAQDLALFREQLGPVIAPDPNASRLLGRLDDLQAQLVALDGDLRRLSTAVQSPLLVPGSMREALRTLTEPFANRTGIEPRVEFVGNLSPLTDSQQIALLSLIREALSNIRQHSGARHVEITIAADGHGVRAEVRDDGAGFDPEVTLVRAARAGRLGLVGMHERVRMLGGRTRIDSRPGGPTMISATLPPWPSEDEL